MPSTMFSPLFYAVILAIVSCIATQACTNSSLPKLCSCQPMPFNLNGENVTCEGLTSSQQVLKALKSAPNCSEFNLLDSEIPSFPLGISLHHLQFLNIKDSKLPYLSPPNTPESAFDGFINLREIAFRNIEDISELNWTKLHRLPKLKTLYVIGGRFADIPKEFAAIGNNNVSNVILLSCQINNIEDGGLAFPNAKYIRMEGNQLSQLSVEIFHPDSNIERLRIMRVFLDTRIPFLPEDVFKGLKKLKVLQTDKTMFEIMSEKHLQHVQLEQFQLDYDVEGGKPKCDCKYTWLLKHKKLFVSDCVTEDGTLNNFSQFLGLC